MRVILFFASGLPEQRQERHVSRPYAWRVLGILPILKASACTNTDETWQMVWYGMRTLNSSSTVHCARQAPRGAEVRTKRFPWFISARLSLSN